MKKLYVFFIAMISVSALFAQDRSRNNYQKDIYQQQSQQWNYNQSRGTYKDNNYSKDSKDDHRFNVRQPQMQEQDRRIAIDRINSDYDQRISRYRNDRYLNSRERDRRIAEMQQERQLKINSIGKAVFAGALIGLVAGAIFSH